MLRKIKWMIVAAACLNFILPLRLTVAADPPGRGPVAPLQLRDIALQDGGLLQGQLLDRQGRPLAGTVVQIAQRGSLLAQTRVAADGRFAFRGLRGGVVQVISPQGVAPCRLWAPRTAPPNARPSLLMVQGQMAQRGQLPFAALFTNPLLLALIIGAAVAIPVIVNQTKDKS